MSETKISKAIAEMIEKEFPDVFLIPKEKPDDDQLTRITRLQCGKAKGWKGGVITLADPFWFDRIGYTNKGVFVGIEIKDPDGTTDKKRLLGQKKRLDDLNACGGIGLLVDSVDECREMIKKILEEQR